MKTESTANSFCKGSENCQNCWENICGRIFFSEVTGKISAFCNSVENSITYNCSKQVFGKLIRIPASELKKDYYSVQYYSLDKKSFPDVLVKLVDIFPLKKQQYPDKICHLLTNNHFQPLAHPWNVQFTNSFFHSYYFDFRCSSGLGEVIPLTYSHGRFTCYFNTLHYLPSLLNFLRMSIPPPFILTQLGSGSFHLLSFDLWFT